MIARGRDAYLAMMVTSGPMEMLEAIACQGDREE
jgi:hypothetical protein